MHRSFKRQTKVSGSWAAPLLFLTLFAVSYLSAQTRSIPLKTSPLHEIHVLSAAGPVSVSTDASTVTVSPNQLLVAREASNLPMVKRRPDGVIRLTLPYKISGIDAAGYPLDLQLVVDVDKGGMTYVSDVRRFEGRLYVGVIDSHDPSSSRVLPQPISLQVTGQLDQVEPAQVTVANSNLPFQPVRLLAATPPETVSVSIRCSFAAVPTEAAIAVLRPMVSVTATPTQIDGLGLQTAKVSVRASGFTNPKGMLISLSADRGGLEKTSLELNESGMGETSIRSIGGGRAIINAELPPAAPGRASVDFQTPWAFFICAILGGAAGTIARLYVPSKARKLSVSKRIAAIAAGIVIGLLVAAAYAVGVNLTTIRPAATVGEALIFVVAGVGAYVGKLFVPGQAET